MYVYYLYKANDQLSHFQASDKTQGESPGLKWKTSLFVGNKC